ncbi:hypothetical protein F2Q70_00009036 [Brassica cretica]|uniref:Uncharacterized protein n=2 Tax=Brassica cretica TaxID=69181 RepID=A0A3N6QSR5_BRACR|nr:hypothetical protein F2Q68_00002104 [Brassica cretica]KAF2612903.1 hypothetical protein F2Q70_00009036 [Brassica cretica]KAF3513767.1 hypothetical protein F2Q69_00002510 [Brassica cretica]KAF3546968.1 hypothetical protein DY000_02002804 [Brassica cretica]
MESSGVISTGGTMWKRLFENEDLDITVPEVHEMLENSTLSEWKWLQLALIALVDGLIVCGNKHLKVSPSYIEIIEDPL